MADADAQYTAAQVRRTVLDLGAQMKLPHLFETGFDEENDEPLPPSPRDARRGRLLAGAIGMACTVLIDDLFDDVVALDRAEGALVLPAGLRAVPELPPAYVEHYDPAFLRRFLTVTVDLSRQLLGGWAGLTCVAQELAMRLVLNRVGVIAKQWSLGLDPDWFGIATEQLYWDIDHEFLYRGGYLSRERAGLVEEGERSNMHPEHWFEPFNDEGIVNLYANTVFDGPGVKGP